MRPRRLAKVYPSKVRPFRTGDRAGLWFGKIVTEGVIDKIYVDAATRNLYAVLKISSRLSRCFPLWQLVPVGSTWFTYHHILYEISTFWDKIKPT